jgi:ComF family protein
VPFCGTCSCQLPAFDTAFAAFRYEFPLNKLVQRLKYQGHLGRAKLLGMLLGRLVVVRGRGLDGVVPVPLHRAREATRGYNQALEIGRYAAAAAGLPLLASALERTRATAAQAGLGALQRRSNVAGAFRADRSVAGRRLALLDDVLTTGHTAEAAASALKAAGAAQVEVWVVARAAAPRAQR